MFSLAFVNAFFDFQNYDKPISQFLDDSVFFHIEPDREKKANLYVMNCVVELEDNLFQLGQQVDDRFSQIDNVCLYEDKIDSDGAIVSVYIRYDARFFDYNR